MTYGPKEDPGSRHEASISPTHPTPAVPGHISDQKRLLGEQNITGSVTDAALPILPAIEAQPAANATTESKSASIDKKVINVTTILKREKLLEPWACPCGDGQYKLPTILMKQVGWTSVVEHN